MGVTPMSGQEEELKTTYINLLQAVVDVGAQVLCIPALATGSHGFDKAQASKIAVFTLAEALSDYPGLALVFCTFTPDDLACYKRSMIGYFHPSCERWI